MPGVRAAETRDVLRGNLEPIPTNKQSAPIKDRFGSSFEVQSDKNALSKKTPEVKLFQCGRITKGERVKTAIPVKFETTLFIY